MAKETAAARRTRIEGLLSHYDEASRQLRKLAKDVDSMKEQIKEIPPGTYGEWIRSAGTPREIMDQQAVKRDYEERGATLPTKTTDAPIVVTHAAASSR